MRKFVEAQDPIFMPAATVGAFKGAVLNLSNNDYHALDKYWSSTHLKALHKKSPRHFQFKQFEEPKEEKKKKSDEMILGSVVHCMTLTPQDFAKEFFMMPELNLRTNDGKAERDKIISENSGKDPVSQEVFDKAMLMTDSVLKNNKAMELLGVGRKEAAYFWECPFSGLNFKAKLDQSSSQHFCELKTAHDASPAHYAKQLFDLNYDLSLVHYREALRIIMGVEVPAYFIVVESEAPYVSQVYKVGEETWQTGHAKWLKAVTQLEQGLKNKTWPGYFTQEEVPEINPPIWAVRSLIKGEEIGI